MIDDVQLMMCNVTLIKVQIMCTKMGKVPVSLFKMTTNPSQNRSRASRNPPQIVTPCSENRELRCLYICSDVM